jgi:glutaminase
VCQSENQHADRNRSLAYYLKENKVLPPKTNIEKTLELYFQACSITATCETMAVIAATLAAGGI